MDTNQKPEFLSQFLFDKRIVDRNIKNKFATQEEYEAHLASLPDDAQNAECLDISSYYEDEEEDLEFEDEDLEEDTEDPTGDDAIEFSDDTSSDEDSTR